MVFGLFLHGGGLANVISKCILKWAINTSVMIGIFLFGIPFIELCIGGFLHGQITPQYISYIYLLGR